MIEFSEENLKQMRDLLPELNHVGVIDGKVVPMTNRIGEVHSFSDLMEIAVLKKECERLKANLESKTDIANQLKDGMADVFEKNASLQAERDALAAKCLRLENFCAEVAAVFENMGNSSINSARLKRIDKTMNADAKSVLAAHDAEVAKTAFIAGAEEAMEEYNAPMPFNVNRMAEHYAAQLRAKAGAA